MTHKNIYKRVFQLVKPYMGLLILAMIGMLFVAGFSTAQAYMVKPLLDKIFVEKNNLMLSLLPLALILLFAVKGAFQFGYSYIMDYIGNSIINNLRITLYHHIISQPMSFLHKAPTGELISRIMNDVSLLQKAVSSTLVSVMLDFFKLVGLLGYIFYQDWKLAMISVIFLPLSAFAIVNFGKNYRRYSTKKQQAAAIVTTILHETITGNRILKAFGMELYEKERFTKHLSTLLLYTLKECKLRNFAKPLMELLGGLSVAVILWYGGHQVLKGVSTPGTFFSFLAALAMIYDPIKSLGSANSVLQQGVAAAVRIFNILDVTAEELDRPGAAVLPPVRDEIEFQHVGFSYDGQAEVLTDINLTVRAGEILAIVGASGGGKTTLVNLLPRFFDVTQGRILFDGMDIRDVTLKSLRRRIGIVSQETILFNDTVRGNIAYGDHDRPEEEILAAAEAAHAMEFIKQLPEGLDTVIGESGNLLSGGQRQRISIARALLKDAPILVLDEATSALDTESEREVQKALENLMRGRTTFIIAHRLSTIKNADRIIVMQDGQIVEEGNHDDLLALHGVYEKLHNMQ